MSAAAGRRVATACRGGRDRPVPAATGTGSGGWSRPVVALLAVTVALSTITGASAWDRFEDLPRASEVRRAQRASAGLFRGARSEVRFAPDGSAVAWRDGDLWRSLPLAGVLGAAGSGGAAAGARPTADPGAGWRGEAAAPGLDGGGADHASALLDLSLAETLEDAPDWPAWAAPVPRHPAPPPPPPPPGRGLQALSAVAPGGRRVAHHRNGNVVIVSPEGEEWVTTEGSGALRYGNASWVYGEELDQRTAMWWSPDGRYLAYYRFDDSPVQSVPMLAGQTSVRPRVEWLPYPKPGEPNPIAGLEIYDTESKRRVTVDVGPEPDQYIYWCRWTPDGSALMFNRTNRRQNLLEVLLADPRTGESRLLLTEEQETWQANHPGLHFLSDGERFIWESERSGYLQYELWDLAKGRIAELTRGDFPVQSIVRLDEAAGRLWYTALGSETRINPQLFVVNLDGTGMRRLTPRDRHYSDFTISADGRWFTAIEQFVDEAPSLRLFDAGDPAASPVEGTEDPAGAVPGVGAAGAAGAGEAGGAAAARSHGSGGAQGPAREVAILRPGDPEAWTSRGLVAPEFFTCTAADGVTPLYGILHRPSDFDPSRKYPLLIEVYGGPGVQTVHTKAAVPDPRTELGLLIARVDNRGTPGRGKAFESATYLRLGGPDVDDQAAAARFLAQRPCVDAARIGIAGHSYGGYATIMALLRHPEVFSVGVAGAAVTDWRQYDTIYTERYMRTPQENPEGYDAGSAVTLAGNLRGRLLLIHGLVDDNVHATNVWALAHELQRLDIPFQMMIFPEADHGVHGAAAEGVKWSFLARHLGLMDATAGASGGADGAAPRAEPRRAPGSAGRARPPQRRAPDGSTP